MALTVHIVCRPALASGFELAGLGVTRVPDASTAADRMRGLLADPRTGMILIDEGLYRALPRELVSRFDRQALPVIAPIPTADWDVRKAAESYVLEILRQAIGYRVRPR